MLLQVDRAVSFRRRSFCTVLLAAAAGLSACEKAPLLAPGGTVIFLSATSNSVASTGSVEIIAVLLEQGTASSGTGTGSSSTPAAGTPVHNGTLVSFSTTIGRIEPAEARTENGQVKVRFVGDGRSGAAKILAYSGGARSEITLNVGAAAAERVLVTATSLPSGGGNSTVVAKVEDASGNPLPGVVVQFSTTRGSLSSNTATTNDAGNATVVLTTSVEATVTATAGSKSGTATVTPAARSGLAITAPATITASAPAQFTVSTTSGSAVRNVRVDFGDGGVRDLGAVSGSQAVQYTYSRAGNYTVTLTATMNDGSVEAPLATPVSVGNFQVTLAGNPSPATTNTSVTFTATLAPSTPSAVNVAFYRWDFGDGTVRDTEGPATSHIYGTAGNYTVRVTVVPVTGDSRSNTTSIRVN